MEMCGKTGVVVDEAGEPQAVEAAVPGEEPDDNFDKEQCFEWLTKIMEHHGEHKEIVQLPDGTRITVAEMMDEVMQETERGSWFVQEYVRLRDG